ncbi:non-ribosomal peptide synthetase [Amycolatopsis rubida]|uniref:Nonribosomal peptide synthetase protein BlmIX n=2 Tax=Amycolatopsis rubida TaxID=112413 RepID=A0A1I6AIM0_9PSEU|nr:non-ribosomal peptide synthetase [Amycolatopsis rubida]SFQ68521.1 nonribosomal peptide synthetase protein BlmIX [Amycolatopsis rubida]
MTLPAASGPLAAAQQRLWFLQRLAPDNPAYTICTAIDLAGPLNPAALRWAIARIGDRHEMLRAVFADDGAGPGQRIASAAPRLRLIEAAAGEPELRRLLAAVAARPADFGAGPPVEWLLLRTAPRRHVLVLSLHHLVFDGGSLAVVREELEAWYRAAVSGVPAQPPPPAADYRDLVSRQQELSDQDTASRAFWRAELAAAPPRSSPFGNARGGEPVRVSRQVVRLGPSELAALARLCRRTGSTTFMALLAVLGCWVGRYSGQRDVVLGSPVALRESERSARTVGLLINMLPLRLRLDGEPGFAEVLRRARNALLDALDHRWLPFERIVDELGVPRELESTPLFQVLFAYQRPPEPPGLPGIAARLIDVPAAAAKYELTVTGADTADGLELIFEADGGSCAEPDLAECCRRFRILLAAALAEPDRPVERLDLTTPEQRRALRAPAAIDPGEGELVHRLVEAAAARQPDAVAVAHGSARLSYRMLDAWADRIAADLRARGSRPDEVIGVWLPRTPALVAAVLGVLKAGAAFLPIGTEQPAERVRLMLAETGSRLVLGDDELLARRGAATVALPEAIRVPAPGPGPARRTTVSPRALAYVLYTSGSTGRPKGVAIEHRSAAAFLRWAGREFGPDGLRSVLATTSIGFDLAFFELFAPLAHGGTAVLAEDALRVPGMPAATGATLLNSVPSAVAALLDVNGVPASVDAVNLAGEPLPRELADRLQRRRIVVRNLYGPSEATTYATAGVVAADGRPPTIGTPVGTVRAWAADDRGRPVPDTVTGELRIGGPALARGYHGLPARTAEAFVPDPFGAPGSRVYRTGDLVRRRSGGELVFAGRRDTQVKVRGVRVELGEVEQVLRTVAPIRDVVVLADGETAGDRRLVAFASAVPGERLSPERALAALRPLLPAVMIPSAMVVLAELPHTANGKLDRAALAHRASAAHRDRRPGQAPRTALERDIAREWQRVLGIERVGVHEGFFALGGNSLGLLRLHHALASTVHSGLRLVDLFRFPDIASLAGHLDRPAEPGPHARPADPAQARGRRRRQLAGRGPERRP